MNKILVKDFVDGYSKCTSDEQRKRYIKANLVIEEYIPYEIKDAVAKKIIESTTHASADENSGTITAPAYYINTAAKNMLMKLNIINMWTNIQVDFNDSLSEYNMLCKSGLFATITKMIPEMEVGEFVSLVDWARDDFMLNEMSVQGFVSGQIRRITDTAKVFFEPLVEKFIKNVDKIDENTIQKMFTVAENNMKKLVKIK